MAEEQKAAEPKEAKEPKGAKEAKKKDKKKDDGKREGAPRVEKQAKPAHPPRLWVRYNQEIVPALMKEFNYRNRMQVPRLKMVSLNMGLGESTSNPGIIKIATEELTQIAGQQAVITRSKKAIANFKLRAGLAIGCRVTLRRVHMWEFLDRLLNVAMPRVRDFKGVNPKGFDGRGNYTLGVREQIIFPEVNYDKVEKVKGLNVTVCTTARTDEEGKALLKHLGMPFREVKESARGEPAIPQKA